MFELDRVGWASVPGRWDAIVGGQPVERPLEDRQDVGDRDFAVGEAGDDGAFDVAEDQFEIADVLGVGICRPASMYDTASLKYR